MYTHVFSNFVSIIMLQDKDEQAFKHFQQVLRLAPDHKKAMEIYKKAKLLKQKKEEGIVIYNTTIQIIF